MIIPILRIFDAEKAKEFYIHFLDFKLDWDHRFNENAPLYMQISNLDHLIHLSEHHGDCCPGAAIRIEISQIEQFHKKILSKQYKYSCPGLEVTPWNTKEIELLDPFGNKVIFYETNHS
ncbi:glyoxalase superfamily protein [Bacillus gaemokensis]|uniref:Bleomycin resistance protein n=1 Tax=Bacillus gaemokensis TaxID=574375 RepID=A0A073K8T2_9BACI|nr:glyoxalase/bleomycin resistance/extradiol dioxygenase family protein [Bacillus gaemokensis]KEK22916.1 bleomycin resistance protein [Bacillus gaemokensis]KYG34715.1 bleomycin resistance protein [Bacillus gaemokensis]